MALWFWQSKPAAAGGTQTVTGVGHRASTVAIGTPTVTSGVTKIGRKKRVFFDSGMFWTPPVQPPAAQTASAAGRMSTVAIGASTVIPPIPPRQDVTAGGLARRPRAGVPEAINHRADQWRREDDELIAILTALDADQDRQLVGV